MGDCVGQCWTELDLVGPCGTKTGYDGTNERLIVPDPTYWNAV